MMEDDVVDDSATHCRLVQAGPLELVMTVSSDRQIDVDVIGFIS
jgi:hypothetical protein